MNARWDKTLAVFEEIIESDPTESDRILERQCGSDEALRAAVMELVDANLRMGDFLEGRAFGGGANAQLAITPKCLDRRIDRWRILRVIGAGGMGVVFEVADSDDGPRYALKVIRCPPMVGSDSIRAWRREAALLARLDHPAIARFVDAGISDQCAPYIVMELVRGTPLDRFIRTKRPSIEARVAIMRRICDGLSHAHQRGVIHRDLKPPNILISDADKPDRCEDSPSVKILDFGLAAVTAGDGGSRTVTHRAELVGTLAYMCPERLGEEPRAPDVRDDVFSLGACFYEMLTGRRPHDLRGLPIGEAVRRMTDEDPPRPRRIDRAIPRDLEAIVLKALSRAPSQRYQSVDSLSDDLQRYRTGQPLAARRPGATYELRKFVVRHRELTAACVAFFLLLVGGASWLAVLYDRAHGAEHRAMREAEKSRDFSEFLKWMMTTGDPYKGPPEGMLVRDAVKLAAERLDHESHDPAVEAELRYHIGTLLRHIGEYASAEHNMREAVRLSRSQWGEKAVMTAASRIALAEALLLQNKPIDPAELQASVDFLAGQDLSDIRICNNLSSGYQTVALAAVSRGDYAGAEAHCRAAIERLREGSENYVRDAVKLRLDLAHMLRAQEREAEADVYCDEALKIAQSHLPEDDMILGSLYEHLSAVRWKRGKLDEALELVDKATAIYRRRMSADNMKMMNTHIYRGRILCDKGEYDAARGEYEQALAIVEPVQGPNAVNTLVVRFGLAKCALGAGRHDEAVRMFGEVAEAVRTNYPDRQDFIGRVSEALDKAIAAQRKAMAAAGA